ncbi:MAG TPA: vanadium-dependent haloperoxidase [Candidatus Acidoferrales bacterium]|nr:vanadium-dependent haloperoxidase [Candidatus Acidoferrales bacterium]
MRRSNKLWFMTPLALASALHAGNVVADWTAIGSTTIVANGGKASPSSFVWFAYSSLAMYDAVNAITGEYEPFYYRMSGPSSASVDAAAAAAAHRILVNYFPAQQAALDTQYNASLAALTASPDAKTAGVAVGEAAAMAVISARTGDGLEASVSYTPGSGPGAWIPTPPAYAAPAVPWLGQMRPFTMKSPSDQLPDPPRAFSSEPWSRDYNLTRNYGGTNSTDRSARETEIAIFWTEHTGQQFARAFNDLVTNNNLGTADAARMMAMLWTGVADSLIGCFNAKYKYGFWRPITAIEAGGQRPDTLPDPAWVPLATTPNHPEYPAAHGCATGAASTLIADFFGTTKVHIVTDSLAFADGVHQHVFEDTRDLMDEVFWARIYAGFHFYHSLEAGRQLGETVAQGLARNHFRAMNGHRGNAGNQ